ncbi:MAG: bifunctional oligoribonuclease/PAP phosphatase NrnA [Solirubrobacteraceae bacterium]|jgi:phosphoesterase RecJ-like protein
MSDATALALEAREAVLAAIDAHERFLLVTHENPDGDALGSLIAMQALLMALDKDSLLVIAPDDFPLPREYSFLSLDGLVTGPPPDLELRTVMFLDCGNLDRNPLAPLLDGGSLVNIDHHHDNTRFGAINYVVEDASCTAEIVWDLLRATGVELTTAIAEALYVGLVTDTGRFSYENTTGRSHEMAAELIAAGVDVAAMYRRIYEEIPQAKLALLCRALASLRIFADGRLATAVLTAQDFAETGAEDNHSEGVIDHLRALSGVKVAMLVRELSANARGAQHKVSLRATDNDVDVSAIARMHGGGGHRRAAGFTSDLPTSELIDAIRAQV